MYVIKKAL